MTFVDLDLYNRRSKEREAYLSEKKIIASALEMKRERKGELTSGCNEARQMEGSLSIAENIKQSEKKKAKEDRVLPQRVLRRIEVCVHEKTQTERTKIPINLKYEQRGVVTFQLTRQYSLAEIIMVICCVPHSTSSLCYSSDSERRIQHAEPASGQSVKSSIVSNKHTRAEGSP
ncbi:uncharacterized protein LOC122536829 [Frieseomelitta varia]|uniref:uncharacterized protein LOC122536829 n=1 Tax=Frieseomelitta varia TaxID=561572 RepID=UPI001CB6818E|nr:uncharacterized protein LOC122536829 [Frieseomelitta varia]